MKEKGLKELEEIKPKSVNSIYEHEKKEKIREILINLVNKKSNIIVLESPACIVLKKLLEKGFKNIKIPNNEEYDAFPEEYKKYVYPFNLGNFLGNFNFEEKIDLVWADFCGTWGSYKEEIVPLFHKELLNNNSTLINNNSTLIITTSMRDVGKNDLVKEVITYLENVTEYSGYVIRLMNETAFSGNGTYTVFLKINYADKPRCPKCFSSYVIKRGTRYNKFAIIQRYGCKLCDYKFSIDADRLKTPPYIRQLIYKEYKKEPISSRDLSKKIMDTYGYKLCHTSVLRVIKDAKKYLGKNVEITKKTRITKRKGFSRKTKKGYSKYAPHTYKREVVGIK